VASSSGTSRRRSSNKSRAKGLKVAFVSVVFGCRCCCQCFSASVIGSSNSSNWLFCFAGERDVSESCARAASASPDHRLTGIPYPRNSRTVPSSEHLHPRLLTEI